MSRLVIIIIPKGLSPNGTSGSPLPSLLLLERDF